MTKDTSRLSDGWVDLSAGIDSGRTPNLIAANQVSFAINTTFRGGWPTCRPGYRICTLNFDDDIQSAFEDSLWQVAGGYNSDDGSGSLITMQGGRQFRIYLTSNNTFEVQEITIPGDPNPPNRQQAWCCQGENFFIIQDGQSAPFIYNGGSSRRSAKYEVPTGRQIVYYMGRLWVAQGREYVAGDIVGGPSGNPTLGYRNSMLFFTENLVINEGGAFSVPVQAGDITGFKPIASINTALGQGELIVTTRKNAFAISVPQDRATWKNTTNPLQRIIKLSSSAYAQNSLVNVNEDLFYRSRYGINSIAYAVRNAGQWGNKELSNEVRRILSRDSEEFLQFSSGVNFDNRLLMTTSPAVQADHGVYHRGLVSLDFDLITSMREELPPAWEGVWTGLRILQVLTVEHYGVERCFAFVLNVDNKIELWEISKNDPFDNNGTEQRIAWSMESRAMNFGSKFEMKELESGDLFYDEMNGSVDFDMDFRPDSYACWIDWDNWNECSKNSLCVGDYGVCPTLPNFQTQYRPKRQLVRPPDSFDPIRKEKYRSGYEFQARLSITGKARVKQHRFNSYPVQERPSGKQIPA